LTRAAVSVIEVNPLASLGRLPGRISPGRRDDARAKRPDLWKVLVPIIAVLAGLLLATTARTARGTDLRSSGQTNLADLIRTTENRGNAEENQVKQLQSQVAGVTNRVAAGDAGVAAINASSAPLRTPAGVTALSGPGVTVELDDSHETITDPSVDPNWLVVHQSDMQAVVNALWAGGAEAISVEGQRLIQTSAIRCVGNTLLLNGRVYSPPFDIAAIGPQQQMRQALQASPDLEQYRKDAASYGLKYRVNDELHVHAAAYDAPVSLNYAQIGR
jgi:uncharacterized protein YlxW (UPF0749 family)